MKLWHRDKETGIVTRYKFYVEDVRVNFNDGWRPRATLSLYHGVSEALNEAVVLYSTMDCPKKLYWAPPEPKYIWGDIRVEHLMGKSMRREVLATGEEVDEMASGAEYDGRNEAHIVITKTLSTGISTVWLEVRRKRYYSIGICNDAHLVVEFRNPEECTRFLEEDMWKLRHDMDNPKAGSDVAVIGDIVRAPGSMCDDDVAHDNAARRGVPRSQFIDTDERPQLETQLIPHRAADPGHDPPSYVMLHVTLNMFKLFPLDSVSWSAINSSPAFPLCSDIFRSLSNLLLKFRQPASHDRYDNSSSQAHQGDLTITNSARDISFMDATNSVSVPINSAHHPVTINYINAITGDGYFGAISGGNVGGRNNDNSSSPPAGMSINPPNPLTVLRSPTGASTKGSPPERITTDTTSRQSNTADSLIQEAIPEPALSTGKACTRSLVSFAIFVAHIICRNISW